MDAKFHERAMDAMQVTTRITADCLVWEIVEYHPQTTRVFVRHGLHCVGCSLSPFHTVADCAREHEVQLGPVLDDLNRAISPVTV
ncbi:DUF1858 domain-containing protein [Chloroflexota bacterium]